MSIFKVNNISKGEKSLLLAESQSERMVAKLRFSLASVCAFLSLYLFAANKIDFGICSIQIGLLLFICVYSGIFLFEIAKGADP